MISGCFVLTYTRVESNLSARKERKFKQGKRLQRENLIIFLNKFKNRKCLTIKNSLNKKYLQ